MENTVNNKLINKKKKFKWADLVFYCCLLLIPVLHSIVFYFIVNFNSIRMAFQSYNPETLVFKWNNFENFGRVFRELGSSGNWGIAFKNCYLLWAMGLVTSTPLTQFISYYVYKNEAVGDWFKVALFAPTIVSHMVTLIMFKYFANDAIPAAIDALNGDKPLPMGLLVNKDTRFWTIWGHGFFTGFGAGMMLYVNAMKSISVSIVEAAKLDGIGYFTEYIRITFPMIFPTFKVFFVLGISGILGNQFGGFELYGESAPPDIQTVGYNLFVQSSTAGVKEYPFLSAFGLFITILSLVPTLTVRWLMNKIDPMEN